MWTVLLLVKTHAAAAAAAADDDDDDDDDDDTKGLLEEVSRNWVEILEKMGKWFIYIFFYSAGLDRLSSPKSICILYDKAIYVYDNCAA